MSLDDITGKVKSAQGARDVAEPFYQTAQREGQLREFFEKKGRYTPAQLAALDFQNSSLIATNVEAVGALLNDEAKRMYESDPRGVLGAVAPKKLTDLLYSIKPADDEGNEEQVKLRKEMYGIQTTLQALNSRDPEVVGEARQKLATYAEKYASNHIETRVKKAQEEIREKLKDYSPETIKMWEAVIGDLERRAVLSDEQFREALKNPAFAASAYLEQLRGKFESTLGEEGNKEENVAEYSTERILKLKPQEAIEYLARAA